MRDVQSLKGRLELQGKGGTLVQRKPLPAGTRQRHFLPHVLVS